MTAQDIALWIGAILGGGGIGAIITKIRVQKRLDNRQDVNNFQVLFDEVRKDINRLRDEQFEERKQWAEERKAFNAKIDHLTALLRTQDDTIHKKDIEVALLTGKVELLQTKLDAYQESHTKNVTIKT